MQIHSLFYTILILIIFQLGLQAQEDSLLFTHIDLDSVVIRAQDQGLHVDSFIRMAMNDTSFYVAFANLRTHLFTQKIEIEHVGKSASAYAILLHEMIPTRDSCRYLKEINSVIDPELIQDEGAWEHYTGKMMSELFIPKDTICRNTVSYTPLNEADSRIERYKNELKKFMFMTGQKTEIPFIKDKTEIFSADMRPYYNYTLRSDTLHQRQTYAFTISLNHKNPLSASNTIIKYMKTWFDAENHSVLKRVYHLKYGNLIYDFNVKIAIELNQHHQTYYPSYILYDGKWDIPFNKEEESIIQLNISNFRSQ